MPQDNDHGEYKGAEHQDLQDAGENPPVQRHHDVAPAFGESDAEIVAVLFEPGRARGIRLGPADPSAIDNAVAEAVVDGIVEGHVQCRAVKGLPQEGLQEIGVEGVVEVGHEIVRGLLADGLHHGAVPAHGLNPVDHFSQRDDHPVIELPFAEVDGLSQPDELQHQRSSDGQEAGHDQQADALSGHVAKVRGGLPPVL